MTEVNASALYNIYIKPNKDFKLLQCFFFKYLYNSRVFDVCSYFGTGSCNGELKRHLYVNPIVNKKDIKSMSRSDNTLDSDTTTL